MINKLSKRTAGKIYAVMGGLTILIHLGVITKLIPYTWINGGRSESYEFAVKTSISGILLIIVLTTIILIASDIIKIELNDVALKILNLLIWLIVVLSSLSLTLQFLGTPFEILFVSIIALVLLIMSLRIALR